MLKAASDWQDPDNGYVPFANELVEQYLDPLAALDSVASPNPLGAGGVLAD